LIDDEAPARTRLKELLKQHNSHITIVGEAVDGIEAVQKINELHPDLLFLDICMPGMDGFEVLKNISPVPYVIFCTAFDQYAIKAFETNSIGYLLKPVKAENLDKAIEKLLKLEVPSKQVEVIRIVNEMLLQKQNIQPTSFPVKVGDRIDFIKLEDISYFMASSKYVEIHTKHGKCYNIEHSLNYLEEKLPANFMRVHRATIVNSYFIKEIKKYVASKFIIKLEDMDQSSIITGRNYTESIRKIMVV